MTETSSAGGAMEPPWLVLARNEIGVSEASRGADNARILDYYRDAGHSDIVHDSVAWCAAFACAMLERSGTVSPRTLRARDFLAWGEALDTPEPGCIIVLSRGEAASGAGHVGFYAGRAADRILVLGGNQSDAVSVASFPQSRLLGFRWPSSRRAVTRTAPSASGDADFERALAHVLTWEGGWSEDPFDPGGPTNKGITLAELCRYQKVELTAANAPEMRARLRDIDTATLRSIYRSHYWLPAGCASLRPALALLHFDAAVNQGVDRAIRLLQDAVGVEVDGEIGPITSAAIAATDPASLIATYCELRRAHYRSLAHFWRFGRGWLNRVDATQKAALSLLAEPTSRRPSSSPKKESSPMPDDQSSQPGKWIGNSVTIWGVVVTMLTTVVPVIARATGIDLPAQLVQDLGTQVTAVLQSIGALIGLAMTIFGRVRATQPLVLTPPAGTVPPFRARDWRRE